MPLWVGNAGGRLIRNELSIRAAVGVWHGRKHRERAGDGAPADCCPFRLKRVDKQAVTQVGSIPTSWYDMKSAQTQHESKTRILNAALRVIRAKGYAATRIEDLCEAAGLTKGIHLDAPEVHS
jgi:hypothetical protein